MKEVYDMENPYLRNCHCDYLIKEITDWLMLCKKIEDGSLQMPTKKFRQGFIDGLEMRRAYWQDFFSQPVEKIVTLMLEAEIKDKERKEREDKL